MDPVALNNQGATLSNWGQGFGAFATLLYGIQSKRAAEFAAAQLRSNAGQAQAASQRQAYEVDKATQLATSRALAVAAASGGGASDPTVVGMMANLAAEGSYQKEIALYSGDEQARSMRAKADTVEYEGDQTMVNSALTSAGQVAKLRSSILANNATDASLRQRFGGEGPRTG